MKILVLMPLDEKSVYIASAIYHSLDSYAKDRCFAMPFFMQYLITTKIAPNWTYAVFDSILAAEHLYETAERAKDDMIIFGNMPKKYKFDIVFNIQDLDEDLPYEDKFMDKIRELIKGDETLEAKVMDMYTNVDSNMALHNKIASADFLSAYLKTDPHLEEIEAKYRESIDGNN